MQNNKVDTLIQKSFKNYFDEVSAKCSKSDIKDIYSLADFYEKIKGLRAVHESIAISYKKRHLSPGNKQKIHLTLFCTLSIIILITNTLSGWSIPITFELMLFSLMGLSLHRLCNHAFNLDIDNDTALGVADSSLLPVPSAWVENILKDGRLTVEQKEAFIEMMDGNDISYMNAILFCERFLKSSKAA